MMPENILITGGLGFVGSRLAMAVKKEFPAARVIALDNLRRRGSEGNIPRLRQAGVEFLHGDVRQPEDLEGVGGRIDLILECSAEPSVLAGRSSPDYVIGSNLLGTVNCLNLARRHQSDLIYFSTSRVYPVETLNRIHVVEKETRMEIAENQSLPGISPRGITVDFPLIGCRSLYGATKLASELLIQEYAQLFGFRWMVNRCGVIAGPGQMGKVDQGVFTWWVASALAGKPLNYIGWGGTGKQVRDVLHIDDLAELVLLQMRHIDEWSGRTLNVGGGPFSSLSLIESTALCEGLLGGPLAVGSISENRPDDVRLYVTDNSEVTSLTGWAPRRNAKTILSDIHAWLSVNPDQLKNLLS